MMNDSEAHFKQTLLPGQTSSLQLSADHEDFCGENLNVALFTHL